MVDQKHKFMHCWNHKVASSSFAGIFADLTFASKLVSKDIVYRKVSKWALRRKVM